MITENIRRASALYSLLGRKVVAMLITAVAIGVALGFVEVVTASVLYAVLADFKLVAVRIDSASPPFGLSPIAALLIFSTCAAIFRFLGQLLPALASHDFNRRLREALMRSVLGGVVERHVLSVAEVSHLFTEVLQRCSDFVFSVTTAAIAICVFGLVLAGLLLTSWQMTVVALLFTGLLGLLLVGMRRYYGRYIHLLHRRSRELTVTLLRDARNGHLLRILGANDREVDHLMSISREHIRSLRRYYFWFSLSSSLPLLAWSFLLVALLSFNARMEFLSAEGLLPLVYLLMRLGGSIGGLSTAIGQVQQNRPHVAELVSYSDYLFPPQVADVAKEEPPARLLPLVVQGLSVGRDALLVDGINFSIAEGEMVLVSGPSGRGKTTMIMTLIGLLRPLAGDVSWGGKSITTIDPGQLRRRIGYAGIEPYLLDADIKTNLLFGLEHENVSDADIDQALYLACAEFVHELNGGLAHVLREAGEGISAGQKQRLSLARCLLRRPEILFLDEATANIDEATEATIMEQIRAAYPELVIVAISHRASLRRYAQVIVEI